MAGEQFSLCWDNFHKNMSSGMHSLLESEDLVDVTLAVEGKYLKAHKMVLSVCSPYFRELFQMNPCKHPIVFMKDVSYTAMSDLLTFMYQGEVQVNQEQLTTFIKTAEALQIKGLTSDGNNDSTDAVDDHPEELTPPKPTMQTSISHENDVVIMKSSQKSKKSAAVSHPPTKRQRTSSPVKDKPSLVTVTSDPVPAEQPHTTEQLIQFKMEPYEAEHSDQGQMESYDDNPDDNFGDDGVDEQVDDPDYAMLKGEDEPQAGTSGDGMGERQGSKRKTDVKPSSSIPRKLRKFHRIVLDGFFYNISTTRRSSKRYYRCANKKNSGCLATALIPKNGTVLDLTVLRPHNHPPDKTMELKYNFEVELTKAVRNSKSTVKAVYDSLAEIYPESAQLVPFDQNLCNRLKRRRVSPHNLFASDYLLPSSDV